MGSGFVVSERHEPAEEEPQMSEDLTETTEIRYINNQDDLKLKAWIG